MIPVLFNSNETAFSSFGMGVLSDCISCEVTEERNGAFECVIKYPTSGALFPQIKNERIIKAKPNDSAADQLFRIYRITTPINGVVTVYAQHISYDLCNIGVIPWTSDSMSASLVMSKIFSDTATSHSFNCMTDFSSSKPFSVSIPKSVRACLGGDEGSMLSVWGGEFEWDNMTVRLHSSRGSDNGVIIEYGKNMTDMTHENDNSGAYTSLLPYAAFSDTEGAETVVTLTEVILPITGGTITRDKTLIKDFTEFFEQGETITEEALRTLAQSYIDTNNLATAMPNVTVSFVPLWKQPEYPAILERVSLCDTVTVRHTPLGITAKTKVIKFVYDTLNERCISVTLGQAKSNFINTISSTEEAIKKTEKKVDHFPALIASAVNEATSRITGNTGGYVVLHAGENGKPYELLIMDDPDIAEAVNVWRWNLEGLGYSSTGYNGEFTTAITADGSIVADFITSGTLIANIIRAGVISSFDNSSYWDIETGEVVLRSYTNKSDLDNLTLVVDGVREDTDSAIAKASELQTSIDGLTSYVGSLSERIDEANTGISDKDERVSILETQLSEMRQSVDGLSVTVSTQYTGGMNLIQNSAGLNGLSDDWEYTGTVVIDTSTDVKNSTASDSSFVLSGGSSLKQTITGLVTGTTYAFSIRINKPDNSSSGVAIVRVKYNGDKYKTLFLSIQPSGGWKEYNSIIDDVQDSTMVLEIESRAGDFYVSDIMLAEGDTFQKWSPAPNEIYTEEVKIDRKGIEVSNTASSQRTVITNEEFAGYYQEEKIFTLNKDETQTKKTSVDGELTVGRTKFVPVVDSDGNGLNIVVLD